MADVLLTGVRGDLLGLAGVLHESIVGGGSGLLTGTLLGGNVLSASIRSHVLGLLQVAEELVIGGLGGLLAGTLNEESTNGVS